jgi:hypothetical protein
MPDLLERRSSPIAFGLDDVVLATVSVVASGVGALLPSSVYFDPEPSHAMPFRPPSANFSWLPEAAARIELLSALRPGWDGNDALPVDRRALARSWDLIQVLVTNVPIPPSIVPTAAGGLALEWHRPGLDLEIEMLPGRESVFVSYEEVGGPDIEGPLSAHLVAVANALVRLR